MSYLRSSSPAVGAAYCRSVPLVLKLLLKTAIVGEPSSSSKIHAYRSMHVSQLFRETISKYSHVCEHQNQNFVLASRKLHLLCTGGKVCYQTRTKPQTGNSTLSTKRWLHSHMYPLGHLIAWRYLIHNDQHMRALPTCDRCNNTEKRFALYNT